MGRLFMEYVDEDVGAKHVCGACGCDIASERDLLWEGFMGSCTPALLFRSAVNLSPCSAKRQETLSSGTYTLVDVRCHVCCVTVGWRYLAAQKAEQQYKVGAVLLQQSALQRITSLQAVRHRPAYLWLATTATAAHTQT